jgi:hypothetical protein
MLFNTHTTLSPQAAKNQKLHVVAVVSNPVGYKSRYNLFEQFHKHMSSFNVHLTTVELAFGERDFVTSPGDSQWQFRTWDEIWHKENLVNLGIARLPSDWQYVAWVDADIHFTNPYWVTQTINQLQHNMFAQVWSDAADLGPQGEIIQTHKSLSSLVATGAPMKVIGDPNDYYNTYAHPGFAWAARREAIDHIGGLIDWAAAGSADHHMALALIGKGASSIPGGVTKAYYDKVMAFQAQAERYIRRDIGVVPGTITHYWHGRKNQRGYESRWKILVNNKYNPNTDIKYDSQGVIQLVDHGDIRSLNLRDDLRKYFRSRNEDGIDTE